RHIGHTFNGQKKPDGKRNSSPYTLPAKRKCIVLNMLKFKMGQGSTRKDQQFGYSQYGNDQFKSSSRFNTIDIKRRKNDISGYGNSSNGHLREKNMKISTYCCCDSRGAKNKFYDLRHTGYKTGVSSQGPGSIIKNTTRFGNGAGQLGIGKGKRNV